jgi:hypothetical protein
VQLAPACAPAQAWTGGGDGGKQARPLATAVHTPVEAPPFQRLHEAPAVAFAQGSANVVEEMNACSGRHAMEPHGRSTQVPLSDAPPKAIEQASVALLPAHAWLGGEETTAGIIGIGLAAHSRFVPSATQVPLTVWPSLRVMVHAVPALLLAHACTAGVGKGVHSTPDCASSAVAAAATDAGPEPAFEEDPPPQAARAVVNGTSNTMERRIRQPPYIPEPRAGPRLTHEYGTTTRTRPPEKSRMARRASSEAEARQIRAGAHVCRGGSANVMRLATCRATHGGAEIEASSGVREMEG